MTITKEQLLAIAPNARGVADTYIPLLNEILPKYNIDTPLRVAFWIAQICHESNEFRATSENLNYSAEALLRVFPKYFYKSLAQQYARNPQKIANRVYANRYGNGNEVSGDGWKFRGRGLIQMTFRGNYRLYGYENNPDLVSTPREAVESACKYWKKNNLNVYSDRNDIKTSTKIINGGYNGLAAREAYLKKAKKVFNIQ